MDAEHFPRAAVGEQGGRRGHHGPESWVGCAPCAMSRRGAVGAQRLGDGPVPGPFQGELLLWSHWGDTLALALALAMRRERTWPTSPNRGEAPDAAGPPPPKTAAWPWSPSRSRWSGWRSWTSGSMRFGRATNPGHTASPRARFPSFLPLFQAGAPALPSNTPGGVDAPSLEELMASSDRVGSYAQPEPKAATQRPCPHGPLPLAVVSDRCCTGMGEGGPAQRGVLPRPAVVRLPSAATGSASHLSHDPMLGA